jgi:PTH1 family peptidyl-tRNA hydrolase
MALFQKRTETSSAAPLYTVGATKTVLLIGLGNHEKEYDGTRHNIGFAAVDYFAQKNDFPGWVAKKDLKCEITIQTLANVRVVLCKPTTFMNHSGEAASAIQRFYRVYNPQTLIVYDELDIAFGQLRTRLEGSSAGHNGIKSLIQHIGDDFARLRIGIGAKYKGTAADFVLKKFSKEEQESLPLILREANDLMNSFVFSDNFTGETRSVI